MRALGDLVDLGLGAVDDVVDLAALGAVVAELHDPGAGLDQPAQDRLLARRSRRSSRRWPRSGTRGDQRVQVRRAADPGQLAAALQLGGHGDRVGRLAAAVEVEDRVVDGLVRGPVEVVPGAAPRRRRRSRPWSAACAEHATARRRGPAAAAGRTCAASRTRRRGRDGARAPRLRPAKIRLSPCAASPPLASVSNTSSMARAFPAGGARGATLRRQRWSHVQLGCAQLVHHPGEDPRTPPGRTCGRDGDNCLVFERFRWSATVDGMWTTLGSDTPGRPDFSACRGPLSTRRVRTVTRRSLPGCAQLSPARLRGKRQRAGHAVRVTALHRTVRQPATTAIVHLGGDLRVQPHRDRVRADRLDLAGQLDGAAVERRAAGGARRRRRCRPP